MVTVTIDLPPRLEEKMRAVAAEDLASDIRQAYALELYRAEKISHRELSEMLGLDRFQTSALLQKHQIYVGSLTMEDMEGDFQRMQKLFSKAN